MSTEVTEVNVELTPLYLTADAVGFTGFTAEDFALFEIPGFAERMPRIREHIKPKLIQIGQALTPRLSEVLDETLFPHVAQHLRRTVNPPEETWVAFACNTRAYKPFVHLRVAISAERVRVLAFCEDYAEDKATYAANLAARADLLSEHFAHHPHILHFDVLDSEGHPLRGHALTADTIRAFAERLNRVKGQHGIFGIVFHKDHPVVQSGPELLDAVVVAAATLKPLYDCGR